MIYLDLDIICYSAVMGSAHDLHQRRGIGRHYIICLFSLRETAYRGCGPKRDSHMNYGNVCN